MKYFIFQLTLAALFVPSVLLASPTYTIAPLVFDIDAEPRDIITKEIIVTNTGESPVTLYPSVNNISLDEAGRVEEFVPQSMSDKTNSLASWIEISRAGIDLPIGGSKKIPVTFRINPTPVPVVYHAFISFGNGRTSDDAIAMVKNGSAPGTVVTLTLAQEKNEFMKLSGFLIQRFITSGNNSGISYTLNNSGDQPLLPGGEIIFYNGKGEEVAAVPVNESHEILAPGTEKNYTATAPVKGMFGKYKAFLSVEYGSAQRASVQDTVFFYVFPLKMLLIAFGILLVVVTVIALLVHRQFLTEEDEDLDSDRIDLHVREGRSKEVHHDIDLSKKDS